ncbi:MAG: dihydroorotase family protein [Thermoplasmata archaeon]
MMVIQGRAYYRGELRPLALGIEDGVIRAVKKTLRGDKRIDFGDRVLLPGGIDVHVHFRDPGLTHKEDFSTGSEAAAVGGITSVLDMPNTRPHATTPARLEEKRALVAPKAHVDFGLFGGVRRGEDIARLEPYCHAYKFYWAESFGGLVGSGEELPGILRALRDAGRPLTVHAEDPAAFRPRTEKGLSDHHEARGGEAAEEVAIRQLAAWRDAGRVHVAHLSSPAGLGALRGTGMSAEATPMHLLLDMTADLGARGKVNPPLRPPAHRDALWRAFVDGQINVLATDHAPHTLEEKGGGFDAAPPGAPNVETVYPLMFALVRRGTLSLDVLVRTLSHRPAALFGLPGKGAFEVGMDADIAVFDPRERTRIRADDLHSRAGWTPFEDREAIFPTATFLRGVRVAEGRELAEDRRGRWIPLRRPEAGS